ncbi:putative DUF1769-domain-containing protein [Lyophyllum shimeji]|uniref:DUF1769-domain-containing protein n=1 Tax=Lyophyllum shimeji TaxID=47721 RepID=A0A9P3PV13_LYOSH|nr:putative DUF1769-domain-containing protein [Lyophyllum shimeji]
MPARLRVLSGTSSSPAACTDMTHLVNTGQPHALVSDRFEGELVVYIKGLHSHPRPPHTSESQNQSASGEEYFAREDRRGITWSIQVRGASPFVCRRFLNPISADDVLFGNTFDRPLSLPWGSGAALRFMKYIDPTLEHDLASDKKPWALSPLVCTMPHFAHTRLPVDEAQDEDEDGEHGKGGNAQGGREGNGRTRPRLPPFPPRESIKDDTAQLHLAVTEMAGGGESDASSGKSVRIGKNGRNGNERGKGNGNGLGLEDAAARRAYFAAPAHRRRVTFGPRDVITTDFCYGFLEFSPTLSLRLPGGISFDLMRYWDGQPVRFVCCERKKEGDGGEEPWGRMFWCVAIEMADDEEAGGGEGEAQEE